MTKVTLRLSALETLLKRYVKEEKYEKMFSSEDGNLKFNGQADPIKKGKNQKLVHEVPESTQQYAMSALQKLHTPAPNRLTVEFEQATTGNLDSIPPAVTPIARPIAPTPQTSIAEDQHITAVEETLKNQNTRLRNLEQCCNILATSTKNLENQLTSMNNNIFSKNGRHGQSNQ
jgi:hypothetical protein